MGQGSSRAPLWATGRAGTLRKLESTQAALESAGWAATWHPGPSATPGRPATLQKELRALPRPPRSRPGRQDLDTTWQGARVLYPRAFLPVLEGTWRRRSVHLIHPGLTWGCHRV